MACTTQELPKASAASMAPRSEVPQDRIAKTWFWDETLLSAVNDQIQAQLAQGQKIAASHGLVDFSSVVVTGNRVSSAIASYAKEKEFDHIVMGTGVTNDLERLFLGSVAKDCDCQSSKICHQLSPQSNEKSHPPNSQGEFVRRAPNSPRP